MLAIAAYSEIRVTLNGGRMIFHFSMASFVATTYPTRKPANPYALENVLNKMHYQSVLVVLMYRIIFSSDEFEICFIN